MSLHQHPELKKAVLALPQQEKDKLLVRLVGKDSLLMNQLHFQLLEDEADLDDRAEEAQRRLQQLFDRLPTSLSRLYPHHQAHALMVELKYGSGIINEHAAITKDKMSEVRLRLFLVSQAFAQFGALFQLQDSGATEKLYSYQAGRIKYILGKFSKLHEDLQFEFRDELNDALAFAHGSRMNPHMQQLGLPMEL